MILSDGTIKEKLKKGELVIDPLNPDNIQPASIDLTLGTHYLEVEFNKIHSIDLDSEIEYREIETDTIIIPPKSFLLATTQEMIKLPNDIVAFVEGRSSIGRMGLFIQNAGWVDAGFQGRITLELFNANSVPIKLHSGRRICQLVFCNMDKAANVPYQGKYQGQSKSVGSRVFQDREANGKSTKNQ